MFSEAVGWSLTTLICFADIRMYGDLLLNYLCMARIMKACVIESTK